ncbi:GIY-YIG nuclease family protein [Kineobactrum salinum]|uniref:GIY-YIG nuclease family protein n=1 Tax=Kineobactrum salinum TaxID=2708301 RepID=A0A6C0U221_9GAMM|nr:GIY-YIG nuclease family protein [Kineobactrum salinum]QIB64415.1 GIY-YIG nuclease family protein [Kineobactrum salinum]
MMLKKGQSLELFFIDGKPEGMLTAEVFNWTGHVLMTPHTQLSTALKRTEAGYTGVYLLLGEDDTGFLAYIGEGEEINARIKSHDTAKDWWTTAILITTAGNNLNKAHVKYLESRLVEEARRIGKVALENGNTPPHPSLSEAARANILDYILMVLPALRINSFLPHTRPQSGQAATAKAEADKDAVIFELHTPKHGIHATARLEAGEFVVQTGSKASLTWRGKGTEETGYALLLSELRKTGVLAEQNGLCLFTEHTAFKSPSAAAAVVNGRPANGTIEWKFANGKTYKEWEADKLAQDGIGGDS